MIDINKLKNVQSLSLLNKYEGKNPYLKKLKRDYQKHGKATLTQTQANYVVDNHNVEPFQINKVVAITEYLGEELKKNYNLSFTPKRILFQFILAETEKSYHVYGKLKQNQKKAEMYWIPKTQVLDDPYWEEPNIEVDFDKYAAMDEAGRRAYKHQEEGIKFLLSRNGCVLADDMGLGKALITSTLVYTPNGKKPIGEIKVGDQVIGSNGLPTRVNGVYPQGTKDLYRITFNDGYSTLCCKEHLWTVTSNNGSVNNNNRPARYTTLSVEQMMDKDLVIEQPGTGWNEKRPYKFKTYYKQSNGQNKWQIPITEPIQFENDYELPIEPYLLGVILGDGHIRDDNMVNIGVHKDDFDELLNNNLIIEQKESRTNIRRGKIDLKEGIVNLGLSKVRSHTKFIPDVYKYASVEDRISILQGLMDTDGHCMISKNGNFTGTEFCSVSEQLADDVAEIVHSLGGIVRKSSKIGSYRDKDGNKVECRKAYRLNIKFSNDINPFRLKRKSDLYNQPKKYKVGRYITNIELENKDEAVCIAVDAPDKLFVIEHGIVTHNTFQSIVAAIESGAEKILIVCPSSMKIAWKREIESFGESASIINGKVWNPDKFTIINFDILKNFHSTKDKRKPKKEGEKPSNIHNEIVDEKFDLVIVDEAHNLKNHKSIRGQIMTEVCVDYGVERVWLLTGTPVANRPMDFYNLLKIIKSPLADNWIFYVKRYCEGKKFYKKLKNGKTKQIWLTNGASNLDELATKSRNLLLRRLKENVLDMPEKTISTVYHQLTTKQRTNYDNLWDEYLLERKKKKKRGSVDKDLVELILLRKFMANETIESTLEMVDNAVEQGQKVIVFTNFQEEQDIIMEKLGSIAVAHNGSMNETKKQVSVDRFQQDDKIKVFIGNIQSAGVGITLTAATTVIFNSLDWVPGNVKQAIDRAYRIGQKNNVSVYFNIYEDTVDERVWESLFQKSDVIGTILGDADNIFTSEDDDEFKEIIENVIHNEAA